MAHALTFDTLDFVETLKTSGFDENQAKGMAHAIKKVQEAYADELLTKAEFQIGINQLRTEFKADISELKTEMTLLKWMVGLNLAATAGLFTMMLKGIMHGG